MKTCIVLHKYGVRLDDPCCYPLGVGYIAAVLKRNGHDVKVMNYNLRDYDFETEIGGQDAVLFTGFEEFLPYIIRDAAICRAKGIQAILGGALATFKPVEMLRYVDTVVMGEGEEAIERAFGTLGAVKGCVSDLSSLPYPDYDALGIREYHRRNGVKHIGVLTSRGCPYSCRFCSHTCRFQMRDLADVFEEIDHYRAIYGPDVLVFNDNTLNLNKPRFMAICEGMEERNLPWTAAIRVDVFDEEMALAAKAAHCRYFVVGVESFMQPKLDAMCKRVTVNQILRTLDLLNKHRIGYHGNVLVGLPDETMADIVDEVCSIPQGYNVFPVMVQPFIGTAYQRRGVTKGEYEQLQAVFRQMVTEKGMYCYPEAA